MEKINRMLRLHEGEIKTNGRHRIYKDPEGYWTVGIGRCVDPEIGLGLSDDEVDYLLSNDINRVVKELGTEFSWFSSLNEARRDAMIDMCFNLGMPRLKGFVKALAAMEDENYEVAYVEFMDSRWSKQVGQRADRLCNMIRSGEYPNEFLQANA
jgi:lysozyme